MRMLHAMDQLLDAALQAGREPKHWVIRQDDWLEMVARLNADRIDQSLFPANTYRGVPAHFSAMNDNAMVGLVDAAGSVTEEPF